MACTTPLDDLPPVPRWIQVAGKAAPLLFALFLPAMEVILVIAFDRAQSSATEPHSDPWMLTIYAFCALVFWALVCFGHRLSPQPTQAMGGSAWRARFAGSLGLRGKALLLTALLFSSVLILTDALSCLLPTVSAWIGQLPYWPVRLILAGQMTVVCQWWPFWMSVYWLVWARGSARSDFCQVASENGR